MTTNHVTYTADVDSGEFLASVDFSHIPASKGDYWTPGEDEGFEIEGGYFFKYDEETGEVLRDKQYDISELSGHDMEFVYDEIARQFHVSKYEDDYDTDYRRDDRYDSHATYDPE